jgi:ParB family chromosome partitioning protein
METNPNEHAAVTLAAQAGRALRIPYNRLFLAKTNVRKKRNAATIPALAAMIKAETLLNPLCVVPEFGPDGSVVRAGVIAGGRRFLALGHLVDTGRMNPEELIDCKGFEEERSHGISLAENVGQEPMHPADQLVAFRQLVDDGLSAAQIAGRFGITTVTVERRLALANLAPKFIDAYRNDEMKIEQLQALALTSNHDEQIAVWDSLPNWDRSAYRIRNALTQDEVSSDSRLAAFVGVDAYQRAGGTVRQDLFNSENKAYLQDPELLQRLADEKLQAAVAQEQARGWLWVEARSEFEHRERARFERAFPRKLAPTDEQAEALQDIDGMLQALWEKVDELEQAVEQEDRDFSEEEEARHDEWNSQIEALEDVQTTMNDALVSWPKATLARAGVIVTIDDDGRLKLHEGLVRQQDRKGATENASSKDDGNVSSKQKASFSASLMRNMTAHRTAAVAASLSVNPHTALALLLCQFAQTHRSTGAHVQVHRKMYRVAEMASEFTTSRAGADLEKTQQKIGAAVPETESPAELLTYLLALDDAALLDMLAFHVGGSYDVIRDEPEAPEHKATAKVLETALGLNMAEWWEPTAERFVSHITKAKMVESVREVRGDAAAAPIMAMKKPDAIAATVELLQGSGWVPEPLRPHVSADTEPQAGVVE